MPYVSVATFEHFVSGKSGNLPLIRNSGIGKNHYHHALDRGATRAFETPYDQVLHLAASQVMTCVFPELFADDELRLLAMGDGDDLLGVRTREANRMREQV